MYATDVFIVSVWTGWLQDSGLELESATPRTKASCTADSSLLDASRMVAGCAVDYRFVSLATRAGGIPMLCSLKRIGVRRRVWVQDYMLYCSV